MGKNNNNRLSRRETRDSGCARYFSLTPENDVTVDSFTAVRGTRRTGKLVGKTVLGFYIPSRFTLPSRWIYFGKSAALSVRGFGNPCKNYGPRYPRSRRTRGRERMKIKRKRNDRVNVAGYRCSSCFAVLRGDTEARIFHGIFPDFASTSFALLSETIRESVHVSASSAPYRAREARRRRGRRINVTQWSLIDLFFGSSPLLASLAGFPAPVRRSLAL